MGILGFSLSDILLVLFLVFVVLKIAGRFAYSWWVVFAPLLLGLALEIFAKRLG